MEERILELLENKSYRINKLAKKLKINKENAKFYLTSLIKEKKVFKLEDEYYLVRKGKLEETNEKFGFITPVTEENSEDYYVSSDNFNKAKDGDIVLFIIYKDYTNRFRAYILEVVEHTKLSLVGNIQIVQKKSGLAYKINSFDNKYSYTLVGNNLRESMNNAIARVSLIYGKNNKITAKLEEIIGYKDDPGIEISTIAATYGFALDFPSEVKDEIKNIPDYVLMDEKNKRQDFTNLPIITIDGDDSKDFDDAISIEKLNDGTVILYE